MKKVLGSFFAIILLISFPQTVGSVNSSNKEFKKDINKTDKTSSKILNKVLTKKEKKVSQKKDRLEKKAGNRLVWGIVAVIVLLACFAFIQYEIAVLLLMLSQIVGAIVFVSSLLLLRKFNKEIPSKYRKAKKKLIASLILSGLVILTLATLLIINSYF